jgi:pimeloyl-ACP methyl ester carboxylesterase
MTTSATTTATGTVVSRDGTPLAYERTGTGPPLILVDGGLCYRELGPSRALAAALAGDLAVYAYDRRGRGASGDTPPYAPEREVEDLAALVAEAGGAAFLCGFSSGAELALRAAEAGIGVRGVALYELPFIPEGSRPPLPPEYAADLAAALAAGDRGAAVRLFLTRAVGMPRFVPALMRLFPIWRRMTAVAHTLPYDDALLARYASGQTPGRRDVDVPALVVAGGRSPQWMRDGARAVAASVPGARYEELPGQTHNVKAKAAAPLLAAFFTGLR